jgi:glycosyltransferase involved in cell wall biosynthesis
VAAARRIVRASRPHVVHAHSAKAGLAGRIAVRGRVPTVFQPHAWSFEAMGGPMRRAAMAWERAGARWAGAIVCCSRDEERAGVAAGIDGRWVVVPNSVDLDRFAAASPGERDAARRRLGLDAGAPMAVCVGRLSHQKGQDIAVDAWPAVRAAVPAATLVLVGEGPEREALEERAGPGVVFAGPQDDVRSWLVAADVATLPSRYEGMALGVLEAMACGRSVVVAAADGMAEAVGPPGAGAGGAVVPVDDPSALAEALIARLADPERCEREGAQGRSRVEARHDRVQWREQLAATARQVAGR